jgi:hypothetical protein
MSETFNRIVRKITKYDEFFTQMNPEYVKYRRQFERLGVDYR